jgi:hypothetical protein
LRHIFHQIVSFLIIDSRRNNKSFRYKFFSELTIKNSYQYLTNLEEMSRFLLPG